jgi:hypothetical protein
MTFRALREVGDLKPQGDSHQVFSRPRAADAHDI